MANPIRETKDKKANTPKDAKDIKQNAKTGQTSSEKTSLKQEGKCPPGQTWNRVTGQCE